MVQFLVIEDPYHRRQKLEDQLGCLAVLEELLSSKIPAPGIFIIVLNQSLPQKSRVLGQCQYSDLGLAISDKKNYSAEDGIDGTIGLFRRNSGCSAEQNILEFRSEPFRRGEKCSEFFLPWNKIRCKHSEFRSEPFRGRINNSEFRSVEQKNKQTLGILFRTTPRKRQQLGIPFRSMSRTKICCQLCLLEQDFL